MNLALNPSFCTIRAYFLAASLLASSDFAPVQTIFPEENIKAVVLGSLILIITAAKRLGLYSAFLACRAIFFKSSGTPRFTVDTIFCNVGEGMSIAGATDLGVAGIVVGMLEGGLKASLAGTRGVMGIARLLTGPDSPYIPWIFPIFTTLDGPLSL